MLQLLYVLCQCPPLTSVPAPLLWRLGSALAVHLVAAVIPFLAARSRPLHRRLLPGDSLRRQAPLLTPWRASRVQGGKYYVQDLDPIRAPCQSMGVLEQSETSQLRLGNLDCKPGQDDSDTTGATTWSPGTKLPRCCDMHDLTRGGAACWSNPCIYASEPEWRVRDFRSSLSELSEL